MIELQNYNRNNKKKQKKTRENNNIALDITELLII
jgi:hypothetical protein